ncbi:unnamed protein product [Gulo gulo]|uniref:Uncharacterized protein n=1 Tax=Gulo gulo TaxID=48420 RepID=A0A9X9LNK2_GULGU|nr:unnamed protein product [Gulo gulo]
MKGVDPERRGGHGWRAGRAAGQWPTGTSECLRTGDVNTVVAGRREPIGPDRLQTKWSE